MSTDSNDNAPFDLFELCAALLLGLGAIGAALAGFEANQWGSKQMEAYGDANRFTTKASTQYSEDMVLLNADYAAVAQAKMHIIEAREANDAATKDKHFEIANYFYTSQLTPVAYQAMGFPLAYYVEDAEEAGAAPAAAAPAAPAAAPVVAAAAPAAAEPGEDEEADEQPAPAATAAPAAVAGQDIPDALLLASLDVELDEDYSDSMLIKGEQMFQQADSRFEEGNKSDNIGDMFDLAGIAFTMALFFAGLSLIFKTKMRWYLLGAGGVITVLTFIFMLFQPWTM